MALRFQNRLAEMVRPNASFVGFLTAVLRPLVRMALRHGYGVRELCELLRWIAVDIALHDPEFATKGRDKHAQTKSHAAVITGLTRRDVDQLAAATKPDIETHRNHSHRLARVLCGWLEDPYFHDEQGKPLSLPIRAMHGPSFTELVKRYANDVPPRAVMDRLLASGNIRSGARKSVQLIEPMLEFNFTGSEDMQLSAWASENFLETIEKLDGNEIVLRPRFREVYYRNIPKSRGEEFRLFVNTQLHNLTLWFNQELKQFNDPSSSEECITAGVGMYTYYKS